MVDYILFFIGDISNHCTKCKFLTVRLKQAIQREKHFKEGVSSGALLVPAGDSSLAAAFCIIPVLGRIKERKNHKLC